MLFWRAWHLRNDIIHVEGQGSVRDSVGFLVNYYELLHHARKTQERKKDDKGKGKAILEPYSDRETVEQIRGPMKTKTRWMAPQLGWVKLNTDAGFCQSCGAW
jgi:hypothetical protein